MTMTPFPCHEAIYYDGTSASGTQVTIAVQERTLVIVPAQTQEGSAPTSLYWPEDDFALLYADREGSRVDLGLIDSDGVRLVVKGDEIRSMMGAYFTQIQGPLPGQGIKAGFQTTKKLMVFLVFFGLSLWGLERASPYLLPDIFVDQMIKSTKSYVFATMGKQCRSEDGDKALQKLLTRVKGETDLHSPITLEVSASPMVNAFALPKGNVMLMKGLLKNAKNSDEVAGVLAHELGHVKEQHPLRGLARSLGLNIVIAMSGGGTGAEIAQEFVMMGNSRAMESEADETGMALMEQAEISVQPLADFFDRMDPETQRKAKQDTLKKRQADLEEKLKTAEGQDKEKLQKELKRLNQRLEAADKKDWSTLLTKAADLLSTHPAAKERAATFHKAGWKTGAPVLSDAEWTALKNICE